MTTTIDIDSLVSKPYGYRSTRFDLTVEGIGGGRFCVKYRDTEGRQNYVTGPWSVSRRKTLSAAKQIIREGNIALRSS